MRIPHYLKLIPKLTVGLLSSLVFKTIGVLVTVLLSAITGGLVCAQTNRDVVAVLNGLEIRQGEVDELFLGQIMPLEQQLFAIRKSALENLLITKLLEAEAGKQGISLAELRKSLSVISVEVKPDEVENAYAENILAFGAMGEEEAKERLRLDLEVQKRMAHFKRVVDRLRQQAELKVYLQEPRYPWLTLRANAPTLGPKQSLITIVEFADFQCGYCREAQRVLKQILTGYSQDVRLVFKHLPLDIHAQAFDAARAAYCAGEQERFWEYQDALFASSSLEASDLKRVAQQIKLDVARFEACTNSDNARDAVAQDKREAARWGITSTPTFVINGRLVQGAIDFATFKGLIEQELAAPVSPN